MATVSQVAIVSPFAGTTRDVVEVALDMQGLVMRAIFIDPAKANRAPADPSIADCPPCCPPGPPARCAPAARTRCSPRRAHARNRARNHGGKQRPAAAAAARHTRLPSHQQRSGGMAG